MQYEGKKIDAKSFKVSKPVLNFFKKLPIPKSLAEKVEEIDMDGGEVKSSVFIKDGKEYKLQTKDLCSQSQNIF